MTIWRMPVRISFQQQPAWGMNVWHFRVVGDPNSGGAAAAAFNEAADAIREFYASVGVFANGTEINADSATEVTSDQARSVSFEEVSVGDSGPVAPYQLAITTNWLTESASRRGRGRTFLGPLQGTVVDADGSIATARLTTVRAAAAALVDASEAGTAGWAVGVYGLETSGGSSESPHVLRDVTGSKVLDTFAWLSSRKA